MGRSVKTGNKSPRKTSRRRAPLRQDERRRSEVTRTSEPFSHVVLLMLENRSFDHFVGSLQANNSGIDGVDPRKPPRVNYDSGGVAYQQTPTSTTTVDPDPIHTLGDVLRQLSNYNSG